MMEEKSRLGRGLEEVSQLYLTGSRAEEATRVRKPLKNRVHGRVVRVCHPGSCLVQSFFLANLALELARSRYGVVVLDCLDGGEAGVATLMKSLITARNDSGQSRVSLYGLPDIIISSPGEGGSIEPAGLTDIPCPEDNGSYLLVNAPASIASIAGDGLDAESILLTRTDEKSLLACYAYIKVILDSGSPQDISLVLDETGEKDHARELFRRFAAFVGEKLDVELRYLGALSHDEYLGRSIEEARPLMLLQEHSETKEDMISISRKILLNRQSQQGG